MDFDDLDAAEGEDDAGGVAAAPSRPAYVPEMYMPPIRRNYRLPDFDRLPSVIAKQVFGVDEVQLKARKKVCMRAFVFYGAGDSWYAWAELAEKAPEFCEIAVHEWPSHGDVTTSRGEEKPCSTLDALAEDAYRAVKETMEQHSAGGRIAGAPFGLIGHSIGCLLVVALAHKLRERLGLEPDLVVMLDRGPPHIPLHSDAGQRLCEQDPWHFMRDYNPQIYKAATDASKKDAVKGEKMLRMWVDDIKIANDILPVGFHRFECDLVVMMAKENFTTAWVGDDWPEELKRFHAARDPLMGSPDGCSADFSPDQFEEWKEWAAEGKFQLKPVDANHMSIKANPDVLQDIWNLLASKQAPAPSS